MAQHVEIRKDVPTKDDNADHGLHHRNERQDCYKQIDPLVLSEDQIVLNQNEYQHEAYREFSVSDRYKYLAQSDAVAQVVHLQARIFLPSKSHIERIDAYGQLKQNKL